MALGGTALAGGLAGCSKEGGGAKGLTMWHIWPTQDGQPMKDMLQRFSLHHPDIPLQASNVSTNNLKAKLIGAAQSGSLPEVFALNSAWVKDGQLHEHIADLRPLLASHSVALESVLRPWDRERCQIGPSVFCLPALSANGTSMLFTNGELLSRAGINELPRIKNWTEFTELSIRYVRRLNKDGDLNYIALDPFSGPGMVIHSSLANGIGSPSISADGRLSCMNSTGSLRVAHALDEYVEKVYGTFGGYRALLKWRFRYAGLHRQPAFSSLPYDRQIFAIAAAGSLARYRRFMSMRQLAVQPVPGLDRLHGGMASHSWAYAMSREAMKNPDAWTLLHYLTLDPVGVGQFCLNYGRPSSLSKQPSEEAYRRAWGDLWSGVEEAIALDTPYPASSEDEFLRYQLYLVPMRRLRGESMSVIFADLDLQYQAYLDSNIAS